MFKIRHFSKLFFSMSMVVPLMSCNSGASTQVQSEAIPGSKSTVAQASCSMQSNEVKFYAAKDFGEGEKVGYVAYLPQDKFWVRGLNFSETCTSNSFKVTSSGNVLDIYADRTSDPKHSIWVASESQYPQIIITDTSSAVVRPTRLSDKTNFATSHGTLQLGLLTNGQYKIHTFSNIGLAQFHKGLNNDWALYADGNQCYTPELYTGGMVCLDQDGNEFEFHGYGNNHFLVSVYQPSLVEFTSKGVNDFGNALAIDKIHAQLSQYAIDTHQVLKVSLSCPDNSGFTGTSCSQKHELSFSKPTADFIQPSFFARVDSVVIDKEKHEFININPALLRFAFKSDSYYTAAKQIEFPVNITHDKLINKLFAHTKDRLNPETNYYNQCTAWLGAKGDEYDTKNCDIDLYLVDGNHGKKVNISKLTDSDMKLKVYQYDVRSVYPYEIPKRNFSIVKDLQNEKAISLDTSNAKRIGQIIVNTLNAFYENDSLEQIQHESQRSKNWTYVYDENHQFSTKFLRGLGYNREVESTSGSVVMNHGFVGGGASLLPKLLGNDVITSAEMSAPEVVMVAVIGWKYNIWQFHTLEKLFGIRQKPKEYKEKYDLPDNLNLVELKKPLRPSINGSGAPIDSNNIPIEISGPQLKAGIPSATSDGGGGWRKKNPNEQELVISLNKEKSDALTLTFDIKEAKVSEFSHQSKQLDGVTIKNIEIVERSLVEHIDLNVWNTVACTAQDYCPNGRIEKNSFLEPGQILQYPIRATLEKTHAVNGADVFLRITYDDTKGKTWVTEGETFRYMGE